MVLPGLIIYVHGFGGPNEAPPFHTRLHAFISANRLPFEVQTFAWQSLPITPEVLVHNFLQSQEESHTAGEVLAEKLESLELQQRNCHLIGFSLGANVVRHALSLIAKRSSCLRSVYFLGAAFPQNAVINESILEPHGRYHNYYSNNDLTLKFSYFNVFNTYAAGGVGIQKTEVFHNLETQCTHASLYSYTVLAEAIGYLISWDAGVIIPGKTRFNLATPTLGGEMHWNMICHYKGHLIQQNMHSQHYRAVEDTPVMRRLAWGRNLHSVLAAL